MKKYSDYETPGQQLTAGYFEFIRVTNNNFSKVISNLAF